MRHSTNEEVNGIVKNGYDYQLQVWVIDYIVQACGHPSLNDFCNACRHKGMDIRDAYWDAYSDHALIEMGIYTEVKDHVLGGE